MTFSACVLSSLRLPETAPMSSEIIYKTRIRRDDDDSRGREVAHETHAATRVADDDDDTDLSASASAYATSKGAADDPWWKWVVRHCDYRQSVMNEAIGGALSEIRAQAREHCEREVGIVKRDLEQLRRTVDGQ